MNDRLRGAIDLADTLARLRADGIIYDPSCDATDVIDECPSPRGVGAEGQHYCTGCKQWHDLDAFYVSNGRVSSACKAYRKARKKAGYVSQRKNPLLTDEEKRARYNAYQRNHRKKERATLSPSNG